MQKKLKIFICEQIQHSVNFSLEYAAVCKDSYTDVMGLWQMKKTAARYVARTELNLCLKQTNKHI
jgi:hypothetical protein